MAQSAFTITGVHEWGHRFFVLLDEYGSTYNTTMNGSATFPVSTLNVSSTAGFPSSGTLQIWVGSGYTNVNYTGISGNSFTGVSGGGGTAASGAAVSTLTTAQCGHTIMTANLFMPNNFCTDANHGKDFDTAFSGVGATGSSNWSTLGAGGYTNWSPPSTPDAYDYNDFDFAGLVSNITNPN